MKLEERQAQMRSKNEQQKLKPKPPRGSRAVTPRRAIKIFLAQELKRARRLNRGKHKAHQHYLRLKRSKKKLTHAVRDEFRSLLVSFREMNAAMRECKVHLRGGMDSFAKQSKQFQMGFELGKEYAALNPEIKRQGDSNARTQ